MSGIERKVDKLGRIVLPIGYRDRLGLSENSKVSVSISGNELIITPLEKKCAICGKKEDLHTSLPICSYCAEMIKKRI